MKTKKKTKLLLLVSIVMALFLSFCLNLPAQQEGEPLPQEEPQPQEVIEPQPEPLPAEAILLKAVSKQDDGSFMLLKVTRLSALTNSDDASIDIYNNLDRSIKMDFSGNSHYNQQVNDNKKKSTNIIPGFYKLRVSAPGLSFKPTHEKVNFETRCKYKVEVTRLKEIVDYDNL